MHQGTLRTKTKTFHFFNNRQRDLELLNNVIVIERALNIVQMMPIFGINVCICKGIKWEGKTIKSCGGN